MRVWDIHPGYLNRQSLLGEHRELHGIISIYLHNKKGYSRHPETLRWAGVFWALRKRHQLLAAEMHVRGYKDKSPVPEEFTGAENCWPEIYIDTPFKQFLILKEKYIGKEQGRIPLPTGAQHLWSQHKYSVLARDVELYKKTGKAVSLNQVDQFEHFSRIFVEALRIPPSIGGIRNTLQHMWGYVSHIHPVPENFADAPLQQLLHEVQVRVKESGDAYLMHSTALSELAVWLPESQL